MDANERSNGEGSDRLAFRLLELAVAAGWKSRECIEFAREAHKFVTSTVLEIEVLQTVAKATEVDLSQPDNPMPGSAPALPPPEWGADLGTRRKALQALADRNLMMKEAAEILGTSLGSVAFTAHKLRIRFHGRGSPRLQPMARNITAAANPPASPRMQRRCLSCHRIFEPRDISHCLCDDCKNNAGPPRI